MKTATPSATLPAPSDTRTVEQLAGDFAGNMLHSARRILETQPTNPAAVFIQAESIALLTRLGRKIPAKSMF